MVQNEQGQIAIEYYQCVPKQVTVHKKTYCFVIQWNVCLAWVEPEDVPEILAIKGGCCGQKKAGVFRYANQGNVNIWTRGRR